MIFIILEPPEWIINTDRPVIPGKFSQFVANSYQDVFSLFDLGIFITCEHMFMFIGILFL